MTATPQVQAAADERALARSIALGDQAAFAQLMRLHNQRLFRLARAALRDGSEAEDALQEAYVAAYRGFAQFRGDAAIGTWLARLVLNECLGRLRRGRRRDNIAHIFAPYDQESLDRMGTSTLEGPDQAAAREQMRALLEKNIDELPDSLRIVFVLRCVEEASVEEVAACLGIAEATVRTRQFRARSLLRESLAKEIDLAERDVYDFGGARCDRIVATVMERLSR